MTADPLRGDPECPEVQSVRRCVRLYSAPDPDEWADVRTSAELARLLYGADRSDAGRRSARRASPDTRPSTSANASPHTRPSSARQRPSIGESTATRSRPSAARHVARPRATGTPRSRPRRSQHGHGPSVNGSSRGSTGSALPSLMSSWPHRADDARSVGPTRRTASAGLSTMTTSPVRSEEFFAAAVMSAWATSAATLQSSAQESPTWSATRSPHPNAGGPSAA